MIKELKNKIGILDKSIKPTTVNKGQFETNVKNSFMSNRLCNNLEFIEKHHSYIGKEVFHYQKTFSVITLEEYNKKCEGDATYSLFNPILKTPFIYQDYDFRNFQKDYIKYQIDSFTKELVSQMVYSNSTSPFSNLEFEWIIECKQDLIAFYQEILP